MSRTVRLIAWALVFVSLGATAAAWVVFNRDRPDLDADDAGDVAVGAMEDIGFDATVEGSPTLIEHTTEDGLSLAAWSVLVDVEGDVIELRVQEDAGQLVFVDDNIGDGEQLLSEREYEQIGSYEDHAVLNEVRRRNAGATVATVVIVVVGTTIARRSERIWS